jgi:RHS repeat-associated protein
VASPFRLLGQVWDEESGLSWTRFRCFDAATGRWLSADPLELAGGSDTFGFDATPVNAVDALGLAAEGATTGKPGSAIFSQESAGGTNAWTSQQALQQVTGRTARQRKAAIDAILKEDLANVRMSHTPQYSPYARSGIASPPGDPEGCGVQLGKTVFSSRKDLLSTVVHEELHHRWWQRGIPSNHHSPDKYVPNEKFYKIVSRFVKMKGF